MDSNYILKRQVNAFVNQMQNRPIRTLIWLTIAIVDAVILIDSFFFYGNDLMSWLVGY